MRGAACRSALLHVADGLLYRRPGVILVNAQSRPESITEDASVSYDGLVTVVQRLDAHVTVDLDMKAYVATALVEKWGRPPMACPYS